jgi:hypothetical protein
VRKRTRKWQERFAVNADAVESDTAKISADIGLSLKEALGEIKFEFQKGRQ